MRILLAEDDQILGEALEYGLKFEGHRVDWFKDGKSAHLASLSEDYDAIVLDLGLPEIPGLEVLSRLRAQHKATPVLILTAQDAIEDRIQGLDQGADDYMVKPFDIDELHARLRAITRRKRDRTQNVITHGQLKIDTTDHTATLEDINIELTRHEFNLLVKLVENAGRVYSQIDLEDYLYSFENEVGSNTVQVYIHQLRKKFGKSFIRTIRGVGYVVDKI